MFLVGADDVPVVSEALQHVTEDRLREKCDQIDGDDYGFDLSNADFEYPWESSELLKSLWSKAARDGRAVVFAVGQ
ncbi:MAG: DUF1877 family protein [Pirellulales bacterium]|nr:DUF1877 family protein [Pirellulales bacterium]